MAKKTTTKKSTKPIDAPAPDANELGAHPDHDQYRDTKPHKHGDPLPVSKKFRGPGGEALSRADVEAMIGADQLAENERLAREQRAH